MEGKQHAKHVRTGDSGQRRLVCYSPWGCRVEHDLVTKQQQNKEMNNVLGRTLREKY